MAIESGLIGIGAGLAVGITGIGTGLAQKAIGSAAVGATAGKRCAHEAPSQTQVSLE